MIRVHEYSYYYPSQHGSWLFFLIIILSAWVYFLPTLIAVYREHRNTGWIFLINLLFGLTGIGWFGSFVWAIVGETNVDVQNVVIGKASELERLHSLYKEGAITKKEYESAKKKIL